MLKNWTRYTPGTTEYTNNRTSAWAASMPSSLSRGGITRVVQQLGLVDLPSIWNQGARFGGATPFYSHWDGNNSSIAERNRSAAISVGARDDTIDLHSLAVIGAWLWELQPPKYPFPIDDKLAAQGKPIYDAHCASCHDLALEGKGGLVGQTTPLAEIGTDPGRFNAFTQDLANAMNANVGKGYPWHFTHYRKSDGYANVPLDGIGASGPYLHNGSVLNLRGLPEACSRAHQELLHRL